MTNVLERYRLEVENIRLNLDDKDQILNQFSKSQVENEELSRAISNAIEIFELQQIENQELKEKLKNLQDEVQTEVRHEAFETIKDLELKIKKTERAINHLKNSDAHLINKLNSTSKSLRISPPHHTRKNMSVVKIIEDIDEIKSILVTKR